MEEATANLRHRKVTGNSTLLNKANIRLKVNTLLHSRAIILRKVNIHLLSILLSMAATSNHRHPRRVTTLHLKGSILLKDILNKATDNLRRSHLMVNHHRSSMALRRLNSSTVHLRRKWDTATSHQHLQAWDMARQPASIGILDQKRKHYGAQ